MKIVNKTISGLKKMKILEILFSLILIIYLLSNISTPYNLAPYINNVFTYGSIFVLIVLLFLYSNPIVTLLFVISALALLYRTSQVDHKLMKPSESNKNKIMKNLNKNKNITTLEEEIVGKMIKKPDNIPNPETYQPILCPANGATEL